MTKSPINAQQLNAILAEKPILGHAKRGVVVEILPITMTILIENNSNLFILIKNSQLQALFCG